jgi:LysM repeat protein
VRYRVRPGDTLTSIAAKYRVSIQAIIVANRLRSDTIYDGEELIIP